jgi:hypothetical protein
MLNFLPAVIRKKFAAKKSREMIGWSAADGIGLSDSHPSFKGADRVGLALLAYRDAYDGGEPLSTVASDFLADLFHLLAMAGEDPESIVSTAEMHFHAEYNAEPVFA